VKWHLDRGGVLAAANFRESVAAGAAAPAPGVAFVDFHPSTEILLSYFPPAVEVERVAWRIEWRKGLRVMFRLRAPSGRLTLC